MVLAEYVEDVGSGITVFAIKQRHRGGTASFRRLDVTDAADVQRIVADATDTYGGVDVMINNAGVMPLSALAENKVDEWNRPQGSGRIVNLASIGAHEVEPTAAVYCATKFAVWAISEGLRKEQSGNTREAACAQRCRKIRSWPPCKR